MAAVVTSAICLGFCLGIQTGRRLWFYDGRCLATIRTVIGPERCDRPRGDSHGLMHELPGGTTRWPG